MGVYIYVYIYILYHHMDMWTAVHQVPEGVEFYVPKVFVESILPLVGTSTFHSS